MYKVIDNFLDKQDFAKLQSQLLFNSDFPWYFQEAKDKLHGDKSGNKDLNQFQLTHMFFEDLKVNSPFYPVLFPLFKKLNVAAVTRVKANLNPYNYKLNQGLWHQDDTFTNNKAAVFYLNTCNGYTVFKENNKKTYSQANRIIIFNSNDIHRGTNTTNKKRRVVLNINYYEFSKK